MELAELPAGACLVPVYSIFHFGTSREKIAYIKLNSPSPCPPRSAVPVNHRKSYYITWSDFGKNSVRNATPCDFAARVICTALF
jgi:hypothetical protein